MTPVFDLILNNQKYNLRPCTHSQNRHNVGTQELGKPIHIDDLPNHPDNDPDVDPEDVDPENVEDPDEQVIEDIRSDESGGGDSDNESEGTLTEDENFCSHC
jgi:hypothetical protein